MRHRPMRHCVLWAIAVLTLCTGIRTVAGEVEVSGRVVDGDGDGLAGAAVELRPWRGSFADDVRFLEGIVAAPPATARSDSQGFFELRAPAGGSFRLETAAAGRVPGESRLAHLTGDVELRTLRLKPAKEVEVRVSNAAGEPFTGAWVGVSGRRPRQSRARLYRTGDDGSVVVRVAESRSGTVSAFAPGSVPASSKPPASGALEIELASGVARTMEVRATGGEAILGALVRVGRDAWPAGLSGEGGRFVVHPPESGDLQVTVETAEGHYGAGRVAAPETEDDAPVTIYLEPPATISGRVSDAATDRPLAGARVWLEPDPGRFVESGRDGRYELSFPAGRWSWVPMSVAAAGYLRESGRGARGEVGARGTWDVALHPAVPLSGRVVDVRGRPIEGAEITASSPHRSAGRSFTRSRGDGGFQLPAAGNELYQLEVSKAGYLPARAEAAAGDDGVAERLEVVLRRGPPGSGRVVDPGHEPVAGAEVNLSTSMSESRTESHSGRTFHRQTTTDPEGLFEVDNLAPGKLDLRVTARGYADAVVRGLEITSDEVVDFGTVVLEPGVRLEGRVVDPDGQPLPEATVKPRPWHAGTNLWQQFGGSEPPGVTSDAAGRFVIEDLARGKKLTVEARLPSYSPARMVGLEVPAAEPVVLVLQPKGKVRGVVVDSLGEPVPEAKVSAWHESADGGGGGISRDSDADGRFELGVDASGRLKLTASSAELRSAERWLEVAPGQVVDDLRLVLGAGSVVEGQVLGPAGPVAEARIKAIAYKTRRFFLPAKFTGEDGRFRFAGLDPGAWVLQVSAQGHPSTERHLEVGPGTSTVEIRFSEAHEVHGRVVDETRTPVGGAGVSLRPVGQGSRGGAKSDADGAFVVSLPDGRYRLHARKEGFAVTEHEEEIEVAGAPVFGLEVRISEGGAIVGRVLGLEPERLSGVLVATEPERSGTAPDHEGRYRIENLAPGEWTVVATEPVDGRTIRVRTVIAPGVREVVLDLEFAAGLTLAGRVSIDGEPAPAVRVEARGLDVPAAGDVLTDHRGSFRITDLQPGRYRLEVRREEIVQRRELELATDREIEIELITHDLSGWVADAEGGGPLQGVAVTLEPEGGDTPRVVPWPRLWTDSRGFFRFVGVVEGSYRLRLELLGYATLTRPLAVAAGAETEGLDLRLARAEGLTLKVRLAAGGLPQGVRVAALDAAGQPVLNDYFAVAEDATLRLSSLPAGSWWLVVAGWGTGTVQLAADAPGDPVPVVLPPATRLEVRVPDLIGGNELATLTLAGPDGRPFLALDARLSHLVREWNVLDGRATVDGLPPGRWDLAVTTAGGRSWSASVVAAAPGGSARLVVE